MSYKEALTAAGAIVESMKYFGAWQGEWLAKVKYEDQNGWIIGSFGSCSACDAFQIEFGFFDEEDDPDDYTKRLISFGKTYLDTLYSDEEIIKYIKRYINDYYWDEEYQAMLKYVEENINA